MKRIVFSSVAAICIFWTSGLIYGQDTTLTVTSSGNVGIGTTAPIDKLEIEGGQLTVDGAGLLGAIRFRENDELRWTFLTASFIGDGDFRLRDETTGNDVMTFDSGSGNVGIGTTSPASKLHILGTDSSQLVLDGGPSADSGIRFHNKLGNVANFRFDGETDAFEFRLGGLGTTDTKVVINNAGNLGLGTISPDERLTLAYNQYIGWEYSPGNSTVAHKIGKSSSGAGPMEFVTSFNPGPTGRIFSFIQDNGGPFEHLSILYNGNVGIGATNPAHPLEMASGAHVTAGGVWTDASSRAYKENISNLTTEEAISALETLNPVKFNYKVDKDDEYVGFIAEDVPDLVATKTRKSLSPMDIVAVLTKVVQQQQRKIAELEARLNASQ